MFKFTKTEVIEYLIKAKKITTIEFDVESYYLDLLQSVSLLIEDGLSIYFTHRSFQEYFAAKFIVDSNKELKIQLFKKYSKYANSDDVFELAREMNKDFMDFEIIQPFIGELLREIGYNKKIGIPIFLKYIKKIWEKFEFKSGNLYGIAKSVESKELILFILFVVCPEIKDKELSEIDKSQWVRERKTESLSQNTILTFETSTLKTTDIFVKEIYSNGILFSSSPLKVLIKINSEIIERKKCIEKTLEELLMKE